ncbi:hypothetical protein KHQ06_32660 [Nocardia tengchongensis]|uniref:DUF3592 domain-containing protein n=1 Tax=Nocardia tengchongensis TaxID=2055889 RepID=A0ABX8CLG5_9NOCA|nr:hypothetical protein [Nocardia tengchongensis]QVI20794.1 hypothetical protein KHQ06_32660 [Nocardia tengchongensis]
MAYPGVPAFSYPAPAPAPQSPRARPPWWWIGAGIIVILVGVIGAVTAGVVGFTNMTGTVDRFQRVAVPGSGDLRLSAGQDYTVYYEFRGATSADVPQAVRFRITDPDGRVISAKECGAEESYNLGGHEGRAECTFHAGQDGTYHLLAEGGTDVTVAVGRGLGSTMVRMILIPLAIGLIGFLVGTILIITALVRHNRSPAPSRRHA